MKNRFSTSWTASRQVRKQRKYRLNAPFHIRRSFLSAHLSKELRKKHGKRSIAVRKGDEVLVMRGNSRDKKGKVESVDVKRAKIAIEGINKKKRDGTKIKIYFEPSNLQIISLNLDDRKRLKNRKEEKSGEKKNAPKEK